MPRSSGVIAFVLTVAVALAVAGTAAGGNGRGLGPDHPVPANVDVKVKEPKGKKAWPGIEDAAPPATALSAATATTPVGTVRAWIVFNYLTNAPFLSNFTLKGVGDHSEVWVQNNTTFQAGDCRNDDASRLAVTQEQVDYFVQQFDSNIYPKESATFSVAPPHDGTQTPYGEALFGDPDYYVGDGNRTVILVMNIRDDNYYDTNNANGLGYIAGVHHGTVSDYADRNIITIDSYDWKHRTGANPPNEPVPGNGCTSAPARPFQIEGTFAHEYQHLLERYASPGEQKWVNEGLSDYAMELTGYNTASGRPGDPRAESHVLCFEGYMGKTLGGVPIGGPENSLTWWEDQPNESLCDYGAAWTFMEILAGRYGQGFMTALHNEDLNGLPGLQAVLDRFFTGKTALQVVHEWAATVALDDALDATSLRGVARDTTYSSDKLGASINWGTDEAWSTPGAPPNGSDYVRLRNAQGGWLSAKDVSSLAFEGSPTLPPSPVEWSVSNGALASGAADEMDRAIVKGVAVGAGALSFRTRWNMEEEWDFAFVQVSTDGGATYATVPCDDSRSDLVPDGYPAIRPNLPGLTGVQDWKVEHCDLSAYAGKSLLLAFRAMSDWGTLGNGGAIPAGWEVDDVTLDGTLVSDGSTLAGWRSFTEVRPERASWTVQLVGYGTDGKTPAVVAALPLGSSPSLTLDRGALQRLIGDQADVVAAVVTFDEPTELVHKYARYALRVNGVLQPGG